MKEQSDSDALINDIFNLLGYSPFRSSGFRSFSPSESENKQDYSLQDSTEETQLTPQVGVRVLHKDNIIYITPQVCICS